jgi:hypothetical protein
MQERILAAPLPPLTRETITDPAALRRKLAEVRALGHAVARVFIETVSTGVAVRGARRDGRGRRGPLRRAAGRRPRRAGSGGAARRQARDRARPGLPRVRRTPPSARLRAECTAFARGKVVHSATTRALGDALRADSRSTGADGVRCRCGSHIGGTGSAGERRRRRHDRHRPHPGRHRRRRTRRPPPEPLARPVGHRHDRGRSAHTRADREHDPRRHPRAGARSSCSTRSASSAARAPSGDGIRRRARYVWQRRPYTTGRVGRVGGVPVHLVGGRPADRQMELLRPPAAGLCSYAGVQSGVRAAWIKGEPR